MRNAQVARLRNGAIIVQMQDTVTSEAREAFLTQALQDDYHPSHGRWKSVYMQDPSPAANNEAPAAAAANSQQPPEEEPPQEEETVENLLANSWVIQGQGSGENLLSLEDDNNPVKLKHVAA